MTLGRLTVAAIVAHLIVVTLRVPVWIDEPIRDGDWPIKFTEAYQVARDFPRTGRTWTYSTTHLAGYPAGVYTGVGVQYFSLAVTALGPYLGAARAFRVSLWVLMAITPLVPYLTGRAYRLPYRMCEGILLASIGTWHLESTIRGMWTYWIVAFLAGAVLVGWAGALFARMAERPSVFDSLMIGLLLAAAAHLHPLNAVTAVAILAVPVVSGIARPTRWRFVAGCLVIGAVIVALNWHWVSPFVGLSRNVFNGGSADFFQGSWKNLFHDAFSDRAYRRNFDGTLALQGVLVLAILALTKIGTELPAQGCRQLAVGLCVVFGFAYFGWVVPGGRELQHYRFTAAGVLLAIPLVPLGLDRLALPRGTAERLTVMVLAYLVLVRFTPELIQILSTRPLGTLTATELRLRDWLRDNTDQSGRVLVGQSRIAFGNLLPYFLDRDLIGTPYEDVVSAHRYSNFNNRDGQWFGRPVSDMTDAEFLERIDLLNIRWAVFERSDPGRERFERLTDAFRKRVDIDTVTVYERTAGPSDFHAGSGQLARENGDLILTDLSPGRIVLKFHYLSTLRTEPPLPLTRVHLLGDPVGFIALDNPGHRTIRVYNSFGKAPPP